MIGPTMPEPPWITPPDTASTVPVVSGAGPAAAMPLFVNVGSGGTHVAPAGYIEVTVDADPATQPDYVADAGALPLADHSAAVVFAAHVLEHLPAHRTAAVLAEWYRVLKPGGIVHVRVPDVSQVALQCLRHPLDAVAYVSPAGPVTLHDMLYGFTPEIATGRAGMAHQTGFDAVRLRRVLEEAGFVRVDGERREYELCGEGRTPGGMDAPTIPRGRP